MKNAIDEISEISLDQAQCQGKGTYMLFYIENENSLFANTDKLWLSNFAYGYCTTQKLRHS